MLNQQRNRFIYSDAFIFEPVNRPPGSYHFNCGVSDVDDFFNKEFRDYERIKLCKTYELSPKTAHGPNYKPIAFISYCNDSIKFEKTVKDLVKIPEAKAKTWLPAIKIVWLGIDKGLQNYGYGSHLLNVTKLLFISEENRTGCRVITVDAIRDEKTLHFYRTNGFEYRDPKMTPETKPARNTYPLFFDLAGDWKYDPDALKPF